ncbi:lytic transglycosylase domain-containing protein [Faunimonas sp. B44]|uniref:lytic transglycosylase domain-containing protein n=1 Tax=Faunimonas sp. B44 TaxID=3461493 RepID=UPI0040448ED7
MTRRAVATRASWALCLALSLTACVSAGERPASRAEQKPPPPAVAGTGSAYDHLIARYAAENRVPLPLAHAVVRKESGYNAKATGRGTVGLMQIKPATARGIGFKGTTEELYQPETNLAWGMKYLGKAHELGGGDVCGTALRYQGGHRATRMTAASRRYCEDLKRIMARQGVIGTGAEVAVAAAPVPSPRPGGEVAVAAAPTPAGAPAARETATRQVRAVFADAAPAPAAAPNPAAAPSSAAAPSPAPAPAPTGATLFAAVDNGAPQPLTTGSLRGTTMAFAPAAGTVLPASEAGPVPRPRP